MGRKNYYVCPVCKSKNEDTKKYCDSCGTWLLSENFPATKYNRPKSGGIARTIGKVIGYTFLGIVLVLGSLIYIGSRIESQTVGTSPTASPAPQETEEQYKTAAQSIDYEGLARNPDQLKGQRVKLHGKVFQVMEQGNRVGIHLNVTRIEFGWKDSVYIYYERAAGENRILEDDMLTVWGTVRGVENFETLIGGSVTVPAVDARYIAIE